MCNQIKLAIVDDHKLLVNVLSERLDSEKEISVVICAHNGKELLDSIGDSPPDVILLDLEMPIMNGYQTLEILRVKHPKIGVLILSMSSDAFTIGMCAKRGANGYLQKDVEYNILKDAIQAVHSTGYYFDNEFSPQLIQNIITNSENSLNIRQLTDREIEVLKLICLEKSNAVISDQLNVSIRTIEKHRLSISKKIKTKSVIGMLKYAVASGYLEMNN